MVRMFKPGDRVQLTTGGPVMEVLNYIREYKPWVGSYISTNKVECSWYDENRERHTGIFPQRMLIKATAPYKTGATQLNMKQREFSR